MWAPVQVEGVGFEPTKPDGRQIYSLVRLAAPPPLQQKSSLTKGVGKGQVLGLSPGERRKPEGGFEPTNLPITSRLRCRCATRALPPAPSVNSLPSGSTVSVRRQGGIVKCVGLLLSPRLTGYWGHPKALCQGRCPCTSREGAWHLSGKIGVTARLPGRAVATGDATGPLRCRLEAVGVPAPRGQAQEGVCRLAGRRVGQSPA